MSDIFGQSHLNEIKQGVKWFLDTGQIGESGLTFDVESKGCLYTVNVTVAVKA